MYAPIQRETTLHCNIFSHRMGAYPKWALIAHDSLQYVPCNLHMALFCFVLLCLHFNILMDPNDPFIHIIQGCFIEGYA